MTVNKSKATPRQVSSARTTFTIRNRSGGRRALGVVAGLAKKGYRPDLRAVSPCLSFIRSEESGSGALSLPSLLNINENALSLELAGKHLTWCMKVERGHVCNINLVHFVDGLHQAFFLSDHFRSGRCVWRLHFLSVFDRSVVFFTNGISWTGCPRSHIRSHRCTKRKESSSTKEGTGEKGRSMTVLPCISSILFSAHL